MIQIIVQGHQSVGYLSATYSLVFSLSEEYHIDWILSGLYQCTQSSSSKIYLVHYPQ